VERINSEAAEGGEIASELNLKQQIFEKVRRRMSELKHGDNSVPSFCSELNPDVIVISDDRSLLFEPQNLRVTEWLHRHFGTENLGIRNRLRVHPCQRRGIIAELKAAGFEVVY
jgi:hypothetical protein